MRTATLMLVALAVVACVGISSTTPGPESTTTAAPTAVPTPSDAPTPTATEAPTPTAAPTPTIGASPTAAPTLEPSPTASLAVLPNAPGTRPHSKSIGDLSFDLGRRSTPCGSTYRTQEPCLIGIRWADTSGNEDGFRIYVDPALKVRTACDPGGFPCWVDSVKCEFGGRVAAELPAGTEETEMNLLPTDFGPPSAFDAVAGACIFVVAYNGAGESAAMHEGFAWGRYD